MPDTNSGIDANDAMRPAGYALAVAVVVCVLGVVADVAAPDTFTAIGGWLTTVGMLLLVSVWAGLAIVRRTRQNVARMEVERGSGN